MIRAFEHRTFGYLMKHVTVPGYCLACGACVAVCPPELDCLKIDEKGAKAVLKKACAACGICSEQCPLMVDPQELGVERVFGAADEALGVYQRALSVGARSEDIKGRAQDGGAVTSILASLLEAGFIDGAVVMGVGDEPWKPAPRVARTREELIECAGTKYTRGPSLLGVREAVERYGCREIAVVSTPCEIRAARMLQSSRFPDARLRNSMKLLIALFCTEAFQYETLKEVVERRMGIQLAEVEKINIKGKLLVYPRDKPPAEFPLKDLRPLADQHCKICSDPGGELADISVGAVGSPGGRSTVLIRSQVGVEAFELAKEGLHARALDSVELDALRRFFRGKKRSAKEQLDQWRRENRPLPMWAQIKTQS